MLLAGGEEGSQAPAVFAFAETGQMFDRAADMFFRDIAVTVLRPDAHPFLFAVGVPVIDLPIRNPHDDMVTWSADFTVSGAITKTSQP